MLEKGANPFPAFLNKLLFKILTDLTLLSFFELQKHQQWNNLIYHIYPLDRHHLYSQQRQQYKL